jgi:hypothetical protein
MPGRSAARLHENLARSLHQDVLDSVVCQEPVERLQRVPEQGDSLVFAHHLMALSRKQGRMSMSCMAITTMLRA